MGNPESRRALNLAEIVYRVLMRPEGWRVDDLKAKLGIKDRAYRNYRTLLRDSFGQRLGESGADRRLDSPRSAYRGRPGLIAEVRDGDATYLRLRDAEGLISDESGFNSWIVGLRLAQMAFSFLKGTGMHRQLETVLSNFESRVRDRPFVFREILKDMDRMMFFQPDAPKDYSGQGGKIRDILHNMVHKKRIEMTYESAAERRTTAVHVADPLTLVLWRSSLYLIARMSKDSSILTFAVDRIKSIKGLRRRFAYPTPEEYSPERFMDGSFGIFGGGDGKPVNVELVFANKKWLRLHLTERSWHSTQRFKVLRDGRLRMTFSVRSLVEVLPWVRSFGRDVRVKRPKDLLQGG
ncbi:MAG: WYL domain-containing protein [Deltaproteobacteria bacterium]|nr:WYL domain-containing protein [Deltaproteobacteria bacterium]